MGLSPGKLTSLPLNVVPVTSNTTVPTRAQTASRIHALLPSPSPNPPSLPVDEEPEPPRSGMIDGERMCGAGALPRPPRKIGKKKKKREREKKSYGNPEPG